MQRLFFQPIPPGPRAAAPPNREPHRLEAELPQRLAEHRAIVAALNTLREAAERTGRTVTTPTLKERIAGLPESSPFRVIRIVKAS